MEKTIRLTLVHPVQHFKHAPGHHCEWEFVVHHHTRNPAPKSRVYKSGHFSKQHIWPLVNEAKKGHKV
jgi:hypothetical protein